MVDKSHEKTKITNGQVTIVHYKLLQLQVLRMIVSSNGMNDLNDLKFVRTLDELFQISRMNCMHNPNWAEQQLFAVIPRNYDISLEELLEDTVEDAMSVSQTLRRTADIIGLKLPLLEELSMRSIEILKKQRDISDNDEPRRSHGPI